MLIKSEKQILKAMSKFGYDIIDSRDLLKLLPDMPADELRMFCRRLNSEGYLDIFSENLGGSFIASLSTTGRHWQDYRVAVIKKFILESVFTPIAVAFITTLITLWLRL